MDGRPLDIADPLCVFEKTSGDPWGASFSGFAATFETIVCQFGQQFDKGFVAKNMG